MKGWYISSRPDSISGDTTNWFRAYWSFVAAYANSKFGDDWCLSAEQSLSFHSGDKSVPKQVIIRTKNSWSNIQKLLHGTSVLYFKSDIAKPILIESQFGLKLYPLSQALVECNPEFFKTNSIAARTCLSLVTDVTDILKILLKKANYKGSKISWGISQYRIFKRIRRNCYDNGKFGLQHQNRRSFLWYLQIFIFTNSFSIYSSSKFYVE
ncbi:MAG: hypothetical protein LBU29_04610 [Endomicrobium sp.]|nr:hypothetical protein [Endomicrobium sp.]